MGLLDALWMSPITLYPSLVHFFVRKILLPSIWDRLFTGKSNEQLAYTYAITHTKPGDPDAVLAALDHYGSKVRFLMNVGDAKGPLLAGLLAKYQPKIVLELGGYLGYSAILVAKQLPEGVKLISVEFDPFHAALADKLIEWAGLRHKVHVVIGDSGKAIPQLKERFGIDHIDMVFIDHEKSLYVRDIKLIEASGLLKPKKSVVVADNVLFPGSPEYLRYVQAKPGEGGEEDKDRKVYYKTETVMSHLEYCPAIEDMLTISEVL